MSPDTPLLASQLIVRVCLFLVAVIAMFGSPPPCGSAT